MCGTESAGLGNGEGADLIRQNCPKRMCLLLLLAAAAALRAWSPTEMEMAGNVSKHTRRRAGRVASCSTQVGSVPLLRTNTHAHATPVWVIARSSQSGRETAPRRQGTYNSRVACFPGSTDRVQGSREVLTGPSTSCLASSLFNPSPLSRWSSARCSRSRAGSSTRPNT